MKIKSLLIGMLACTALVGCTDEGLENGTGQQQQEAATRGDAYISFSFTGNTDSSRATVGDGDGSPDDSGHKNAGTTAENKVEEILLIIAKSTDNEEVDAQNITRNSYANLTAVPTDGTKNGVVATLKVNDIDIKKNESGTYSLVTPYRMDYLGAYKVLVVANPVDQLKKDVAGQNHVDAYKTVCDFVGQARTGENADGNFMMSNKNQEVIVANENHNTPAAAVKATVEVERVISKITYRWKPADSSYPSALKAKPNVHPVTVNVTSAAAKTGKYWYKEAAEDGKGNSYYKYWYDENFNQAKAGETTYWVLLKKTAPEGETEYKPFDDGGKLKTNYVVAIFNNTTEQLEYTGYTGVTTDDTNGTTEEKKTAPLFTEDLAVAKANVNATLVQSLVFEQEIKLADPQTYYVELTDYALVNLSKTVYAVRHIKSNAGNVRQFGVLNDDEYLQDPLTSAKDLWTVGSEITSTWFSQGYKSIVEGIDKAYYNATTENGKASLPTEFNPLPSALEADAVTNITNTQHTGDNYSSIGAHLKYVRENAVKADNQVVGLVTGIVFAGKIYDQAGNPVPVMYKDKNGKFHRTLKALLEDKANAGQYTTLTPNSTDDEAIKADVDVYKDGRCYYYSAQIKHFAGNDNYSAEPMEYAIMRNNIYSLAVTKISDMGDASLTLKPEDPVIDIRAYITLDVAIEPWIVRFNDLEL